ncbi:MAG: hypothetical protein COU08_02750 [Candidatus Harrisonbacteria bacterium CG10_big_fil_rev_8_21_14_0_10_42_17]|uniref:Uncharacterized protein n=1 Tax=Candidatus Harrisonbacteria bacterium CG10_big_fil_rev_8_21_14_0_10_42_17 TaxID=1974584 RepID=A0A2M6WHZ5_9BACT|nr:MAG: hypothetical protein COU08_02750 [Candidatus Harrisonbacteria bacterium CG10_big_fil_rev_8_21_14_0_10_42_17]
MSFEGLPTRKAENEELHERAYESIELLKDALEDEGGALLGGGFPVEKATCRLNEEAFGKSIDASEIKRDQAYVARREEGFEHGNIGEVYGELLEQVKTVALNQIWFQGRFVSMRTTKFDDYHNGVDELIIDRETFEPMAAIDTTTNPLGTKDKKDQILSKVQQGVAVKYGVALENNGIILTSHSKLPLFVVNIEPEKLVTFAEHLATDNLTEEDRTIEKETLESLLQQSELFQKMTERELRASYERIRKVLLELKEKR